MAALLGVGVVASGGAALRRGGCAGARGRRVSGGKTNAPGNNPRMPCADSKTHTKQPEGYVEWHDWAEKMAETHRQTQCTGCGLWLVWSAIPSS